MKKILQIVSYPFKEDGLTKIALLVYAENRERFSFAFASPYEEGNAVAKRLREEGCPVYRLPPKKDIPSYMGAIRKIVREGGFDAVYIHGNSALMFFEAWPAKRGGACVITHCHSTSAGSKAAHAALKKAFNRCVDVKIGCSEDASRWAYTGSGIHTVPNGVDTERYRFDGAVRDDIRRACGIGDETVAGFVGRLTRQKNPLFLLEVFRAFLDRSPDAVLLLIGEGELRQEMEKKAEELGISENVRFVGVTDDVPAFLQAMDILIMPSLFEGLPLVPLEAQANGLPVLLSDVCAKETFASPLVVPMALAAGPEAWAEKAGEVLRDTVRGEDGAAYLAAAGLTQDRMVEEIRALLAQCTGDGAEENDQ